MEQDNTKFDELKKYLLNNKLFAVLLLVFIALAAISNFSTSLLSLLNNTEQFTKSFSDDNEFKRSEKKYFIEGDDEAAFELYLRSANKGNPVAQASLAKLFWLGRGTNKDLDRAVFWAEASLPALQPLVNNEDRVALYVHAFLLDNGIGMAEDDEKAMEQYQRSAWKGHYPAQFNLAMLLQRPGTSEEDLKKAFQLLTEASRYGYPLAEYWLGRFYHNGITVEKSPSLAATWYRKAAIKGHANAQAHLGQILLFENKNYEEGFYWLEKASEKNNGFAQYLIGFSFKNGEGVNQDYKMAMDWFLKAKSNGEKWASREVGGLYFLGLGVDEDFDKAIENFKQTAELGDAYSLHALGIIYRDGFGVDADYKLAKSYFERSIDAGFVSGKISLARMYSHEVGVTVNYRKAFDLYDSIVSMESKEGLSRRELNIAKNNLSLLYKEGEGTEKNEEKAFYLVEEAAKGGDSYAAANLAWYYAKGIGVEKDIELASFWVEKAIEGDSPHGQFIKAMHFEADIESRKALLKKSVKKAHSCAMNELALIYENEGSYKKAIELFHKAAMLRNTNAAINFGRVYELMPDGDISKKELASELVSFLKKRSSYAETQAMVLLGRWHKSGTVVEHDKLASAKYLLEAIGLIDDLKVEQELNDMFSSQPNYTAICSA